MFAHQVVDDLRNWHPDAINKDTIISLLVNSQKFHLPPHGDIAHLSRTKLGAKLFWEESESLKFPYEMCWFDSYQSKCPSLRLGILVSYYRELHAFMAITFISDSKSPWQMDPYGVKIRMGKNFDGQFSNVQSIELRNPINSILSPSEYIQKNLNGQLSHLEIALQLLNCKNITTSKQYPPQKLNKKRLKHHKQPLFTYHTLTLKPVGKKQESIPRHLWENRIHLCRGHFKTYTDEKPLFGHITGRFWWQPSVRGRNREGVVMKDYIVDKSMAEMVGAT